MVLVLALLAEPVEVEVFKVYDDLDFVNSIVVLVDGSKERVLPITVGLSQGKSIRMALDGAFYPRPLTHDLVLDMLKAVGWSVERVEIVALKGEVFYADMKLKRGRATRTLDARPSDAIAIALRADAPIFVEEQVFTDFEEDLKRQLRELREGVPDEGEAGSKI